MTRTPMVALLACVAASRQLDELYPVNQGEPQQPSEYQASPAGIKSPQHFDWDSWREAIERELACRNLAYYLENA